MDEVQVLDPQECALYRRDVMLGRFNPNSHRLVDIHAPSICALYY